MRTIVVIEDDDLMRGLLIEWLGAEGYAVRVGGIGSAAAHAAANATTGTQGGASTDGPAAVSASAPRSAQPAALADLVIVDIHQPRHLGAERVRRARSAHPGAALLAMSSQFCAGASGACDKTGAQAAAPAFGADRLIAKPFRRHDLLGAVRALVGPANPVDCATHARQRA